jgi:hypothetical protein
MIDLIEVGKVLAPCLAVYVAIRVDIATLKVRMERAEQDIQKLTQ